MKRSSHDLGASPAPANSIPHDFLTVAEVAKLLRISVRKVWREIADDRLKVHRFGASTRVARADLESYIERAKSEPAARPLRCS